jgi:hypothetical protein
MRPSVGRSMSRSFSDSSRLEYRNFPPISQRSRSDAGVIDESEIDGDTNAYADADIDVEAVPALPEAVVAVRKVAKDGTRRLSETVIVDELPVAFSKPTTSARKFIWVHVPYNNPTWVKVRGQRFAQ